MSDLRSRLGAIRQILDSSTAIDQALVERVCLSLDGLVLTGLGLKIRRRLERIMVIYGSVAVGYQDYQHPEKPLSAAAMVVYAGCINDLMLLADDLDAQR